MLAGAPAITRVLRDEMWIGPTKSTALDATQKARPCMSIFKSFTLSLCP
jgi:hypothetical protein